MRSRTSVFTALVLFVGILGFAPESVHAQDVGTVAGTVTGPGGAPIGDVAVSIIGVNIVGQTNAEGIYLLLNVPAGNHGVQARRIGFAPITERDIAVTAGGRATVNFELEETRLSLQDIVVTGVTDPTEGIKVPFTVHRLNENSLVVPSTSSALGAIQGKIAGAQIIRTSGQPGSEVAIELRTPTAGDTQRRRRTGPMYIVDGVILGGSAGTTLDIESLDIVAVEVISGASAATLYGSRAAEGVISITTNRGSGLDLNTTQIRLRTEVGRSEVNSRVNTLQVHPYRQDAAGNWLDSNGAITDRGERVYSPDKVSNNPYTNPTFDNLGAVFAPASFQQHNLSILQNTASTNFVASFTRYDEAGTLLGQQGYQRTSARLNLDHRIRDDLSLAFSISHTNSFRDNLDGSPITVATRFAPDINVLAPDTSSTAIAPYLRFPNPLDDELENPVYRQIVEDDETKRIRTLGSMSLTMNPTNWLRVNGSFSYDRGDIERTVYVPVGTPRGSSPDAQTNGFLFKDEDRDETMNGDAGVTLLRNFGALTTRITGRGYFERSDAYGIDATGTALTVAGTPDLSNSGATEIGQQTVNSYLQEIRSEGISSDLALDYLGKYIGNVAYRYDGSSLFGPNERWNGYYRGAAAWRMAEEPWWPFEALTEFKLSYAYGTAGGRPSFGQRYALLNVLNNGTIDKGLLGNESLQPERTVEQDYGLTMFLNNRHSFELHFVTQSTEDQIELVATPSWTGFESGTLNGGTVSGDIWEFTYEGTVIQRPNFSWNSRLVLDKRTSEITEFARSCFINRTVLWRCDNSDLTAIWGWRLASSIEDLRAVDYSQADQFKVNDDGYLVWTGGAEYTDGFGGNPDDTSVHLWGTRAPSGQFSQRYEWGMPFRTEVGTNQATCPDGPDSSTCQHSITNDDGREIIGNFSPDANFGFLNTFVWGNFQLYAQVFGQVGGDIYNDAREELNERLAHVQGDQTGKPEGLRKPYVYYDHGPNSSMGLNQNGLPVDEFFEDGTFLKLKEMSLEYRVPESMLNTIGLGSIGADRLTLGLVGRDLLTLTDYTGYDPEVGSPLRRVDTESSYPIARQITFLLNVTF